MKIRNDLTPKFDPAIERWLRVFANVKYPEQYPDLERWLAQVSDLTRPLPVLALCGPPGTGKSLLARGLARIWTMGACTEMRDALREVKLREVKNDRIANCPLILADGSEPNALLAQRVFYLASSRAVRVIVTSNAMALKIRGSLEIESDGAARETLRNCDLESWSIRGIAEHVLALSA